MKTTSYNLTMMSLCSKINVMTPETLWNLGRVSVLGISTDAKNIVYSVSTLWKKNKSTSKYYTIPINGGLKG
jgi:hypothetical protein